MNLDNSYKCYDLLLWSRHRFPPISRAYNSNFPININKYLYEYIKTTNKFSFFPYPQPPSELLLYCRFYGWVTWYLMAELLGIYWFINIYFKSYVIINFSRKYRRRVKYVYIFVINGWHGNLLNNVNFILFYFYE